MKKQKTFVWYGQSYLISLFIFFISALTGCGGISVNPGQESVEKITIMEEKELKSVNSHRAAEALVHKSVQATRKGQWRRAAMMAEKSLAGAAVPTLTLQAYLLASYGYFNLNNREKGAYFFDLFEKNRGSLPDTSPLMKLAAKIRKEFIVHPS